jgi:hypothetical protein
VSQKLCSGVLSVGGVTAVLMLVWVGARPGLPQGFVAELRDVC